MNIEIRHTEPDDYVAVHSIMTSSKVVEGTLQLPFQSIEQMRKRTAEPPEGAYPLVACINGEVVGTIGLHTVARPRRKHVAELGMAVRDDQQGKGVGSALMQAVLDLADNWLNVRRIELTVYTDNAAGIALYKKFGFEIEGTLRDYAFRDGDYVDAYFMGRLREGPRA